MSEQADQVLADLLKQHNAPDEKILAANQRTADRKRRKEKKERLKQREILREKKLLKDLDHIKPDFSTADFEKRLLRIATKGVVTLFNAVAKQQKQLESAEAADSATKSKKAKVETSVKNNFLQLLKNESEKVGGSVKGADKSKETDGKKDKDGKKWSVLSDDFAMKASKMKHWDRASDDEDESDDDPLAHFSDDDDDE